MGGAAGMFELAGAEAAAPPFDALLAEPPTAVVADFLRVGGGPLGGPPGRPPLGGGPLGGPPTRVVFYLLTKTCSFHSVLSACSVA